MANTKTVIEINGNKYDATTGRLLAGSGRVQVTDPLPSSRLVGATHRPSVHGSTLTQEQPAVARPSKNLRHHPVAHHAAHHKPQRSQTLMRSAVNKPVLTGRHPVHTEGISAAQAATGFISPLHSSVEARRLDRARSIGKSDYISKFGAQAPSVTKKTSHLPVRPEPARHVPAVSHRAAAALPAARPATTDVEPIIRALQSAKHPRHAATTKAHHRLARKTGMRRKSMAMAGSALAVLLLAGFVAYSNMPNMAMRVAAAKAGFDARLPEYRPAGFSLADPIQYGPGEITVNFKSLADGGGYKITQRPSKWDSETLLDKFVNSVSAPYQTYQGQDKTIFIYNESDATWVEDGVWYQITGNGGLTSDQLLRIASSL